MRGDKTTGKLNNRGFTLAEVLIVVAILVVLFGLGFAFVSSYIENNRQAAADRTAESIAMAFQNRMQEIYAFDGVTQDMLMSGSSASGILEGKTIRIKSEVNDSEYIDIDVEYFVIGQEKGVAKLGSDAVLKLLTADGQLLSPELFENGILLEFDPVNFRVYSVVYLTDTDKYHIDELYTSENMNIIRDDEQRKRNFKGHVGYYQVSDGDESEDKLAEAIIDNDVRNKINVRVGHYVGGERRLFNSDKLLSNIEIIFPSQGPNYNNRIKNKKVLIRVEVEGETSKNKMVFAQWGTYIDTLEYTKIPLLLDALGVNEQNGKLSSFAGQFSKTGSLPSSDDVFRDVSWIPVGRVAARLNESGADDANAYLFPGENITVSVDVSTYATYEGYGEVIVDDALLRASATASDNSLFAYDNSLSSEEFNIKTGVNSGKYNAFIAYGRHLQNLDESSGIVASVGDGSLYDSFGERPIKAVQIKDIDFNAPVDGEEPKENERFLWYDCYTMSEASERESRYFTPILNEYIDKYDALNEGEAEAQPHKILNIKIDESDLSKSAVLVFNEGKTAVVPRSYLPTGSYNVTVNGTTVYDRYCTGLFRIFWGSEINNLTLIDPQITGIQKVGADGDEDNVIASCGALSGIMMNDSTVKNCRVEITGEETDEEGEDIPTGYIVTVPEP